MAVMEMKTQPLGEHRGRYPKEGFRHGSVALVSEQKRTVANEA
jgi:hypothetical protein